MKKLTIVSNDGNPMKFRIETYKNGQSEVSKTVYGGHADERIDVEFDENSAIAIVPHRDEPAVEPAPAAPEPEPTPTRRKR